MKLDDRNAIEQVSYRLSQAAAIAAILADAGHHNPMVGESLSGLENYLRDLSEKLDAVTDAHSPNRAAK